MLATYPPLAEDVQVDVAIIGAGVTGAAAAYELTRSGASVIVLDRRDVASGSTAASTGLLQYETDTSLAQLADRFGIDAAVRAYRFGLEAIDRIGEMCDEIGDPCGFARRPSLYLASTRRHVAGLEEECALRRQHGFDVALLTEGEITSRFGCKAPAAIYARGDGEINCYRFTHRLLAAAARAGARICDRTAVTRWRRTRGGNELITNRSCRVTAKRVIVAAGYETTEERSGQTRPRIKTLTNLNSTFACATEPLDSKELWDERCVIWETARPYAYLRTTANNRIVIGGEDVESPRAHADAGVLRQSQRRLMRRLSRLFPHLDAEPAYTWGGVFAETRDGLPFIGARDAAPDVWYALGYGANGITFGVIAAGLLRDLYLGRRNADAALFSFEREQRLQ